MIIFYRWGGLAEVSMAGFSADEESAEALYRGLEMLLEYEDLAS